MIIWLASYPRSGNTMTRIALHSLYRIRTYSMHADAPLAKRGISRQFGFIINDQLRSRLDTFRERPARYIIKTHAVLDRKNYIEPEDKALYIVRDGRDALISRAHFFANKHLEYKGKYEDTLRRLVVEDIKYRPWSESVMTWADRPNTAYVRYEDILPNPLDVVHKSLRSLGVDIKLRVEDMPEFSTLQDKDGTFFRRGKAQAWKDEMPIGLVHEFWQRNWEGMNYYGYENDDPIIDSYLGDIQDRYDIDPREVGGQDTG